jgi:hypothetical protein
MKAEQVQHTPASGVKQIGMSIQVSLSGCWSSVFNSSAGCRSTPASLIEYTSTLHRPLADASG